MVGATAAVCILVTCLVILAIYYAYTQGYLCESLSPECTNQSSSEVASNSSEEQKPENLVTSQHSSQQELMTSEDEGSDTEEKLETHRMMV